jgi:hypothetical protein
MGQNMVLPCHAPGECTYSLELPADLEPPIQVYYEAVKLIELYRVNATGNSS